MTRQDQLTIDALMTSLKDKQQAVLVCIHEFDFETAAKYQADVDNLIKMIIELKTKQ